MLGPGPVYRVRTLFLRSTALCFTIAFHSLYCQLPGLYGEQGVLPARAAVELDRLDRDSLLQLLADKPTLLWLTPYTGLSLLEMQELLCLAGLLLGITVLLLPQFATTLTMLALYTLYLSLYQAGQTFLHFQWDILLLECGGLAVLAAPVRQGRHNSPLPGDRLVMMLVRWLLFRMMFASGCVKLTSGCPAWWGLTAMPTHYSSQCLPTPLAWVAALLPDWLHKLSVLATFVIEIPLTFLFFAPTAALRKLTAVCQVFLMINIMLTGNYNFFNLLYIGLCLSLADNSWLERQDSRRTSSHPVATCAWCLFHLFACLALGWTIAQVSSLKLEPDWSVSSSLSISPAQFSTFLSLATPAGLVMGAAALLLALAVELKQSRSPYQVCVVLCTSLLVGLMFTISLPSFSRPLDQPTYRALPAQVHELAGRLDKLELVHGYGLFRRMTGVGGRPEVVIQGANHPAGPWTEYQFLYKPGNVTQPPLFVLPHQPRLDWQMWFAALGSYQQNPWLVSLVYRLLEGRKEVLALLGPQPPALHTPPKYIRARVYKYQFTSSWADEDWWWRVEEGEYLPVLSRTDPGLRQYLDSVGLLGGGTDRSGGLLAGFFSVLRHAADGIRAELQVWSYSWLALPLLAQFLTA